MINARSLTLAALSVLAIFAAGLVLYATPRGLSLSDDSIAYIAGARSILSGHGYREAFLESDGPVTHFPPGFSAALALIGLTGLDPLRGARLLNAFLFGLNALGLGLLGWRMTRSSLAGITLAALFVLNDSLFRVHIAAMSEPLYIAFSLAAFLAFSQYFQTEDSRWLAAAGVLSSCAYLTRYAGLALIATFVTALLVLRDSWRARWRASALFLLSSAPLLLVWSIRGRLVADNATNRRLVLHGLTAENINTGVRTVSEFLAPLDSMRRTLLNIPGLFGVVIILIAAVLLHWTVNQVLKKFRGESPELLSFTNGLYVFGYFGAMLASMLLFDASTKFKVRILAPIFISLLILLVYFGHWVWRNKMNAIRASIAVVALLMCAASAVGTAGDIQQLRKGGQGYASFQWYDSEAMAFLRGLPQGLRIYTNQPGPVYLYTNRPAYVLPDLIDPVTTLPRDGYAAGVAALHEDVLSGHAILALFKFGAESEDVQSIYLQLAQGLYLAHDSHSDKVYTAPP